MKKALLLCLVFVAILGPGCIQKEGEIPAVPMESKNRTVIVEEEVPVAIIHGELIYGKAKVVIVNTTKAYLPLSNASVAKKLWPGFGIRIEYAKKFEKGERFEFERILVINANENVTDLSIGGGKILGSERFDELDVKIELIGEGISKRAKIYSERGRPIAFLWEDSREGWLKLNPGIYELKVTVSGISKSLSLTYSGISILLDARFSVVPSFLQNESTAARLRLDGFEVSYRMLGSIGADEAWRVDKNYVGGFVSVSRFRDAVIMKTDGTNVSWAKVWGTNEDEWVWDVSKGVNCVYSAILTTKNGVLLKLSDDGELVWAKDVKLENVKYDAHVTAVEYADGHLFAGGDFLAMLNPDEPEVVWCRYPLGSVTSIRFFNGSIYVIDDVDLLKFDLNGDLLWAKVFLLGDLYIDLRSMHIAEDGIYVLGWANSSTVLIKLDRDGNVLWSKLLIPESIPYALHYDDGNIYVVGNLGGGKGFLAVVSPETDEVKVIAINKSELRDVTSSSGSVYCVGLARAQNLEMRLLNSTALNVDVRVKTPNLDFKPCTLSLSDAVGSLKNFSVGRGENGDILLVEVR